MNKVLHIGKYYPPYFGGIEKVRQGKVIELDLKETDVLKATAQVEKMCEKLLANTVIENYSVEIL